MDLPKDGTAYDDPRMQHLCTQQLQELSKIVAKQARDRIVLALAIHKEKESQ